MGARTGCAFDAARRTAAELGVQRAMAIAGLADVARYYDRLLNDRDAMDELISELTIGETYFFRQPGQYAFLARRVLPEFRRRGAARAIRVWSAGCATGEEPY